MFAPITLEALSDEQLELARDDQALQRFFFKADAEGLDYALANFLDADARAALQRLDPGLADRIDAAAKLLAEIAEARQALVDLGVWTEA